MSSTPNNQSTAAGATATRRPSLGRRVVTAGLTAALTLSMTIPFVPSVALADDVVAADDAAAEGTRRSPTAKNEVVYTKTDATGVASGIYVVNSFTTDEATDVRDPGSYESVTNLTTSQELSDDGGAVDLTTLAGKTFYYQGDLDASKTTLPWKVELTYTLDGTEVSPEELAGKSGDLDIRLKVTGLDDDSATADFAKSFLVQAQGTFSNDTFSLDDAGDGTVAEVGNQTLVTYLLLPGQDGDWHIKGTAKDFDYSGWQISAMPLTMAIDLRDLDTSELDGLKGELVDGAGQLADGGSQLAEALGLVNAGAVSADEGASTLAAGARSLSSGTTRYTAGVASASAGASQLASGAGDLVSALDGQRGSFETLEGGASQVAGGVSALREKLSQTLPAALSSASGTLDSLSQRLDAIDGQVQGLGSAVEGLGPLADKTSADGQQVKDDLTSLSTALGTVTPTLTSAGASAGTAQGLAAQAADDARSAVTTLTALRSSVAADESIPEDVRSGYLDQIDAAIASAQSAQGKATSAASSAGDALSGVQQVGTAAQGLGATDVSGHANALADDLRQIQSGAGALTTSATQVVSDSKGVLGDAKGLVSSTQQTLSGLQGDMGQLETLDKGATQVSGGVSELVGSLTTPGTDASGTPTLYGAAQGLSAGATQLKGGLALLDSTSPSLTGGSSQVATGASTLSDGLGQLASGTGQALDGSQTLASTLVALKEGVDDLDATLLDRAQDYVDEALGRGYELHSFVDDANTDVNEVEFVYVVGGVTKKDDATAQDEDAGSDATDAAQAASFADRLYALFDDHED